MKGDRARCSEEGTREGIVAETDEQKQERLRKWRKRDRSRRSTKTTTERDTRLLQVSVLQHEVLVAKSTTEETPCRLQQMSARRHEDWQWLSSCNLFLS